MGKFISGGYYQGDKVNLIFRFENWYRTSQDFLDRGYTEGLQFTTLDSGKVNQEQRKWKRVRDSDPFREKVLFDKPETKKETDFIKRGPKSVHTV